MANKVVVSSDKIAAIANAIRTKTGNSDLMSLDDMPTQIASIEGGGSADTRFKELVEGTITDVVDNTITTTNSYAFYANENLANVSLTSLISLGSYSFSKCTALASVDLPSLNANVSTFVFDGCTALQQVNIPNSTGANNYAFQDTTALEKVELEGSANIGSYSFRRSGIKALIIRNNTSKLTKLTSTNAFTDCPIANGTGYIYFYREFVESYKSATGWSNYAEQIRAIEDYPEITGG